MIQSVQCKTCGTLRKICDELHAKRAEKRECRKCAYENKRLFINKALSMALKGKPKTDEHKKKLSIARLGKVPWNKGMKMPFCSEITKEKRRINASNQPRKFGKAVDGGQIELINKWNKLGFNFEVNYKLHIKNFLAYLDGYDKDKNVVLEYDSKYHNTSKQKEKDLIRQN